MVTPVETWLLNNEGGNIVNTAKLLIAVIAYFSVYIILLLNAAKSQGFNY